MRYGEPADLLDVAIIGGGPAGLTAATYLRRFHRRCVVLDAGASRARMIPESHNCPGFPAGVSGTELLQRMHDQASHYGVRIERARVAAIARVPGGFELRDDTRTWRARAVMVATGVVDRLPDVPWAEDAIAAGAMRLCAVCDAYEASDACIGVFGRSDAVGGHARFLLGYSRVVHVLPTDDGDGGDSGAAARAAGVHWAPAGGTLAFDGRRCTWTLPGGPSLVLDTVYPYLGTRTASALARQAGATLDDAGEIVVDRHQQTAVPGLYAIGDIVSGLNQIAVAVGHAAIAATHVHAQLPFVARAPQ